MSQYRILIIDDDKMMRSSLVDLFEAAGWATKDLSRACEAQRWIMHFKPDVILSDVRMPEMTGLELLEALPNTIPIVLISAHGDIPMAVEAMNQGAYSFVEKPCEPEKLLSILTHAAEQNQMQQRNGRLRSRLQQLAGLDRVLLGRSLLMNEIRETINTIAETEASVLIKGGTGTGKDLVARALHDISARCDGAFVAINVAQVDAENLPKIALNANGGTLFLDEICACPMDVQASLLRLIESGEILNLNSGQIEKVDLRVLSATNEDTQLAIQEGRLRPDLLFRLDTFSLRLPALKERMDDISFLALHFLEKFSDAYNIDTPALNKDDLAVLLSYDWPGNVRELRNVIERRVILARQGCQNMADVMPRKDVQTSSRPGLREAVASFERQLISQSLQAQKGRMDDVAAELGIGRRTLNEKIVKLGLNKEELL